MTTRSRHQAGRLRRLVGDEPAIGEHDPTFCKIQVTVEIEPTAGDGLFGGLERDTAVPWKFERL
jgi:hypothetical protein